MNTKQKNITSWLAAIISALIMLQTLYFKFSAAPESVYIFTTLGMEPWGRIGSGIGELIASILILIPALRWLGALMGLGIISGALLAHITKLGIVIQNDGGYLFILGLIVFACCSICLYLDRAKIILLYGRLFSSK